MQPLALALHVLRNAVGFWSCAGELTLIGHAEQRKPIHGRIVFRCSTRIWRHDGLQVEGPAGRGLHGLGIHEPVASYPYFVVGLGKLRQYVATAIIGRSEEHTSELQSLAYLVCRL